MSISIAACSVWCYNSFKRESKIPESFFVENISECMSGISMRLFGLANWNSDRLQSALLPVIHTHPHTLCIHTQCSLLITLSPLLAISSATSSSIHTSLAYSTLCHVWNGLWLIPALGEEGRDESVSADEMRAALWRGGEEGKEKRSCRRDMRGKKGNGKMRREREQNNRVWGTCGQMRSFSAE